MYALPRYQRVHYLYGRADSSQRFCIRFSHAPGDSSEALTPLTGRIGRIARQGLGIVLAILVWGVCIVAFGLFPISLWLAALFLAGAGAANMVSMILRFLIIQIATPDEFRGRISSMNAMFAFGGPLLGQLESGLVASFFSPQISLISGGAACILATFAIVALMPNLLRVQVK